MKLAIAIALPLAALLVLAGPVVAATTVTASITAPPVSVGQSVVFTETFSKEAGSSKRNPQQHNQPTTQVDCSGFQAWTIIEDRHAITGGWQGTTYPVAMTVSGQCTATMYGLNSDSQVVIWASLYFTVAP